MHYYETKELITYLKSSFVLSNVEIKSIFIRETLSYKYKSTKNNNKLKYNFIVKTQKLLHEISNVPLFNFNLKNFIHDCNSHSVNESSYVFHNKEKLISDKNNKNPVNSWYIVTS